MSPDHTHLDAETLAAWMDGGLDASSTASAEAHVSNCERCQAMVATFVRTEAPGTAPLAHGTKAPGTLSLWRWLAPFAAAAAAVAIWMIAPQPPAEPQRQSTPAVVERKAEPALPPPAAAPPAEQQAASSARASSGELRRNPPSPNQNRAQDLAQARDQEQSKGATTDRVARLDDARQRSEAAFSKPAAEGTRAEVAAAPAAAVAESVTVAPAAPPALAAEPPAAQERVGPIEIVSPSPAFRWRIDSRGSIERSEDGGQSWFPIRLGAGETIAAGSSPSRNICWVVGRGGLVLIAVDGVSFVRLPFPHDVDLAAVTATDGRAATVTAADGRTFTTTDSGRTWR